MVAMKIGSYCEEYPAAVHGGLGSFCKDLAEEPKARGAPLTIFGSWPWILPVPRGSGLLRVKTQQDRLHWQRAGLPAGDAPS